MSARFDQWVTVYWQLVVALTDAHVCPECGGSAVDFCFVGDSNTRMGFALVWCPKCLVGCRFSRVRVPEGAEFVDFGDEATLRRRVPDFDVVDE